MDKKYVIGVDFGATKIATIICELDGSVASRVKMDTNASTGKDNVIQRIKDSIYYVIEHSGADINQIAGIGICSPGPLSVSKGMILYVATLDWKNVPIRELIFKEFRVPVYLENDCNAAAFGELYMGAGKEFSNLIYIAIGTGIGSGIIIDKKIYHGKHDSAGELGHICVEPVGIECSCGNNGCLQAYASGTSIAKITRENIIKKKGSLLLELSNDDIGKIDCLMVEKAAIKGDPLAIKIWNDTGFRLGLGISILMQMFDPEVVIIGGSVSKAWDLFYKTMINTIKNHTYKLIFKDIIIVPALLGENASVLGAAMIALNSQNSGNNMFLKNGKII